MRPPYLQINDLVALVAPARKITAEELQTAIQMLEGSGLRVKLGSSIGRVHHQFAGTDAERAADLQQQLDDPEVRAIFCVRGGYGSVRIIDRLRWEGLLRHPKWVVGFSDVTVLHAHINKLGMETVHGEMPFNYGRPDKDPRSFTALMELLHGEKIAYPYTPHPLNRSGKLKGRIYGGNLSVWYSLLGSPSLPDTRGALLFLEDLDEYLYHIDRMLVALKRSGQLAQLSGLLIGGLTQMNDNAIAFGQTAEQIIAAAVADYDYPVCFNFPAGHTALNLPLVLGGEWAGRLV